MDSEASPASELSLNRGPQQIAWLIAAAIIAWFARDAVRFETSIDRALPFLALALLVAAAISRSWLTALIPALVALEIVVVDERVRLLSFGIVVAIAFASAIATVGRERRDAVVALVVMAVLILRWIPLANAPIARELVLLGITVATTLALGATPFAAAVAIATALLPPLLPMRTLAFPLAVLVAAVILRILGLPALRFRLLPAAFVGAIMLFFPWSGLLARAPLLLLRGWSPAMHRAYVGVTLHPGDSMTFDVPQGATALIASGANVSRLRTGTVIARVNGAPLAIGDVADWGFLRREHRRDSRNPLPRDPAGSIRDYGYASWVDAGARVPLAPGVRTIVVAVERNLTGKAALQVEGFEVPQ